MEEEPQSCRAACQGSRQNYRRGRPGTLAPASQLDLGLRLIRLRKLYLRKFGSIPLRLTRQLSFRGIASRVGVFSPDTIMHWARNDMSPAAIRRRLKSKARPRLFTEQQEHVLAGWCIYKDLTHESSTTRNFREFALSQFRRDVKSSYLSKFLRRHRLSMKLTGNAKNSEREEYTIEKAVSFLQQVEFLLHAGLQPSQLKVSTVAFFYVSCSRATIPCFASSYFQVLDKTYLISSPWHKYIRHIAPKGSNKPRKLTPQKGSCMYSEVKVSYVLTMPY